MQKNVISHTPILPSLKHNLYINCASLANSHFAHKYKRVWCLDISLLCTPAVPKFFESCVISKSLQHAFDRHFFFPAAGSSMFFYSFENLTRRCPGTLEILNCLFARQIVTKSCRMFLEVRVYPSGHIALHFPHYKCPDRYCWIKFSKKCCLISNGCWL